MSITQYDYVFDADLLTSTLSLFDSINTTLIYRRATQDIFMAVRLACTISVSEFLENIGTLDRWFVLIQEHFGSPHKDVYGLDYKVQITKDVNALPHLRARVEYAGVEVLNAKYNPATALVVWAARDEMVLPVGFFQDVVIHVMNRFVLEVERYNK